MAVDVNFLNGSNVNNIDTNFQRVKDALQETLSRNGGLPNQMNADLDMNSNDILNGGIINGERIFIDGIELSPLGKEGWTPVFGAVEYNGNVLLQLVDYEGGTGVKPSKYIGWYLGPNGYVEDPDDATNFNAFSIPDGSITDVKVSTSSKLFNRIDQHVDIRDFGAVGDGTTDNTTAINNAILFAQGTVRRLFVPPSADGFYCAGSINSAGWMEVYGGGQSSSRIIFGGNNGWYHAGGDVAFQNSPQFYFHDLSLQTRAIFNTAEALLHVEYNPGGGGTSGWSVIIERFELRGETSNQAPKTGLKLTNCTNARVAYGLLYGQATAPLNTQQESYGINIITDSQAVDMYFDEVTINFFRYGGYVNGAAVAGTGPEGIIFNNCLMIGVDYGVHATSTYGLPYIVIKGCNFAAGIKPVLIRNFWAVQIIDNFFYIRERGDSLQAWFGIDYGNTNISYSSQSVIKGNLFYPISFVDNPTKTGIAITQANTSRTDMLIEGNSFAHVSTGVQLGSGVTNVKITDTNKYDSTVTNATIDGSGNGTNVISTHFHGTTGYSTDNQGTQMAWARRTATLDVGLRASITFPVAFKNNCYVVNVTNSNASVAGTSAIVADSLSKTGFSIYVPGGVSGNVVTISYLALGN